DGVLWHKGDVVVHAAHRVTVAAGPGPVRLLSCRTLMVTDPPGSATARDGLLVTWAMPLTVTWYPAKCAPMPTRAPPPRRPTPCQLICNWPPLRSACR